MKSAAAICLVFFTAHFFSAFGQGSLTPPGAPAPTMKSLDQIEPRTIVNGMNTPGTVTSLYMISQPGSYYLTTNLTGVPNKNGINITANNVTLDLNGFAVQGSNVNGFGIIVLGVVSNLIVRNGTVSGWGNAGVDVVGGASASQGVVFERLNISDNGTMGLTVSGSATVRDCVANNNAQRGFQINGGILSGCTAQNNGTAGFYLTSCTLIGCMAQSGPFANSFQLTSCTASGCAANSGNDGFYLVSSTVSGCTAQNNKNDGFEVLSGSVTGCLAQNNGIGIYAHPGTVTGCYITGSTNSGILLGVSGSVASGNTCTGNNRMGSSFDAGIYIGGDNSRVENNQLNANGFAGIKISSGNTNNVVIRNTATANGGNNYLSAINNDFGPLGTAATATSPWANISH